MEPLVSAAWLADRLDDPDLVVLDATYFAIPTDPPRDEAAAFAAGHVPGARFLDLRALSGGQATSLPAPDKFAGRLRAIGIDGTERVVLVDDAPHRTSARAWWLFRRFAPAMAVAILDGGLGLWRAEGRPLATGAAPVAPGRFVADPDLSGVRTKAMLLAEVARGEGQRVDARSPGRFDGSEADPRGLPSGHIPGSRNLPYGRFFRADGTWRSPDALALLFADAGIDLDRPIVTTCGSGITAAVPAFALHLLGRDAALYDGSWTEWAADPATPKVTA